MISNELTNSGPSALNLNELWQTLFKTCLDSGVSIKDDQQGESIRSLVSEIIGKLSRLNPSVFLPELQVLLIFDPMRFSKFTLIRHE